MIYQRHSHSLRYSASTLSRIASLIVEDAPVLRRGPSPLLCWQCQVRNSTHHRNLSTAAEYKPYTFENAPPPPRNANVPDTSISRPKPESNERWLPHLLGEKEFSKGKEENVAQASISLPESEAQKPKPVAGLSSPSSSPAKRTSKLRPRKAAMNLTQAAILQLRNLLDQPEPKLIRVGVKNRGCSGLAYQLEYVEKPGMFDETVEQEGVKVLVDSKALFSIIGSEMDWVEDKLEQRFVFRNPNIKEQCGCGESFMV